MGHLAKRQNLAAALSVTSATSNNVAPVAAISHDAEACLITFHICFKIVQCLQAFLLTAQPDTEMIAAPHESAAENQAALRVWSEGVCRTRVSNSKQPSCGPTLIFTEKIFSENL